MKQIFILTISLLLLNAYSYADKKDADTKVVVIKKEGTEEYTYEDVVKIESVTKAEMFSRAKKYIIANFKTNDNNIQFDESNFSIVNTSTVILEPKTGLTWQITSGFINFKLSLDFKDGRYKFIFSNIVILATYIGGETETSDYSKIQRNNKPSKFMRDQVNEKLFSISSQLEKAIKGEDKKANDW
jgi:hypothetical protein